MKVDRKTVDKWRQDLEEFLGGYKSVLHGYRWNHDLVTELQRESHHISSVVYEVHGGGGLTLDLGGKTVSMSFYQALNYVLTDTIPSEAREFVQSHVELTLNQAIGNIDRGTFPTHDTVPKLAIRDVTLNQYCLHLLAEPSKSDTAIREATLVLEDRLRKAIPQEELAQLIPEAANLTFENLVTTLLSPKDPILLVSTDERERRAFFKMMEGVATYLRNPFHHRLDDATEWSLAWSVVGLVDQLLFDLSKCVKVDRRRLAKRSDAGVAAQKGQPTDDSAKANRKSG